ncbi:MAG: glycosyltransferase [Alphaproteobacteria bacterium]|nr:glycosyltransferase [Alphaproteobacteria bacterium]
MSARDDALLTVIFPTFDLRGRAADRVRKWAREQSLAREHYRVNVVVDDAAAAETDALQALLGPGDRLIRVRAGRDADHWNEGAAAATTKWLVFVEGHSFPAPDCLAAAARWIAGEPAAVAGNFAITHRDDYLMARLSARWFGGMARSWAAADSWPRLHRAGCIVRADVFAQLGGFEPEYGQFAPPLLSARLHARGLAIVPVPGAAVLHQDDARMRHHHADTMDFVRGELDARRRNDPDFFTAHFGDCAPWTNRLAERPAVARRIAAAILVAARTSPRRSRRLLRPFLRAAAAAALGIRARVALRRAAIRLDEFAVERLPMPASWRWARFLAAHRRVVETEQLDWIGRHDPPDAPPPAGGRVAVERLGPDALVGVHGLEEAQGCRFRWSDAVLLVRVAPGVRALRIETGALRGDPLAAVIAVVVGGRALPRDRLGADAAGTLTISLPGSAADGFAAIVCKPPARPRGAPRDPRTLGLPIVAIEGLAPAASPPAARDAA